MVKGIAAFVIVLFHFMKIVYQPRKNFIAHGFLAVDFIFCLSGFVIAYTYHQGCIEKIGITKFLK
jgi:peptidoglycan/LPS O-acetylase OafA/YrhL